MSYVAPTDKQLPIWPEAMRQITMHALSGCQLNLYVNILIKLVATSSVTIIFIEGMGKTHSATMSKL